MTSNTRKTFPTPAAEAFSRLYRAILGLLGRRSDQQGETVEVNTDLCLARAERRASRYAEMALPEVLLQAFSDEPLAAGDARFIGREEQSKRFLAGLERWRSGHGAMLAITGPQGCGISSLLQQLGQLVDDQEIYCYSRLTRRPYDVGDTLALLSEVVGREQPSDSLQELVEYIGGLTPRVFAVDNGHFLACRMMGANGAIRVFGAVMVATQQRHLWVLGCQEQAWRRLAYVYRADRYFSDRIELPLFSEVELGQCLTARLQVSGMAPDSDMSGGYEQPPALLARQLPTLHRLSNGKPDFAFFYFLSSLLVSEENGQLDMQTIVALDFSALKQLLSEELFSLAEVAAHGQLTVAEHRAVFRISQEESWLLLERLCQQCLLDKDETSEPAYRLMPLYSDVITRHLGNANYLY